MAMDRLVPQRGPGDDIAVIALQIDPVDDLLELELRAYPTTLARVRQTLGRWLRGHDVEREIAAEITIAVSEACANAVEHAYGPGRGMFTVRAEQIGATIHVSVMDQGQWRAPRGEHRGRGLKIMRAAMDSLDVRSNERGTEILMTRGVNRR